MTTKPKAKSKPQAQIVQVPARLIEEKRNQSMYIIDALTKAAVTTTQVDMVSRLWEMQKEAEDRQAEREFGAAKVALAFDLPTIPKNHSIEFVDKNNVKRATPYADRVDIETVLDPICRKHGFSKEYTTDTIDGKAAQVLIVRHAGGHKELYRSPYMPLDTTGSKNNNQAAGSTSEYGKRYALIGAFNIIGVDKDDDGNLGKEPQEKTADKFSERVQAEANTPEKLSVEDAADILMAKMLPLDIEARGALLMKHKNIIKALMDAGHTTTVSEIHALVGVKL